MTFGYSAGKGKYHPTSTEVKSESDKDTVQSVLEYPIIAWDDRGISLETAQRFGVRAKLSETDGRTPVAVYFPYYSQKGDLTGWKRRDLTKDKSERGHFSAIGKVGVDSQLFGQHVCATVQRKNTNLFVVEGEWDVLSAFQSLRDSIAGDAEKVKKYGVIEPYVVGLSCGTVNAAENVQHNRLFVTGFEKVTLGLDNDEATPKEREKGIKRGKEATEDIAAVLMKDNLYVVKYSQSCKDPSDYLQDNRTLDLANTLQFKTQKFIAEKVVTAAEVGFEAFTKKREEGVMIKRFPKLMKKIRGLRKRELVILTSPSGVGKSTVTSEMAYCLAEQGMRVGMIFLEETVTETMQRMGARHLHVKYNVFKNDPRAVVEEESLKETFEWLSGDSKFVFLDHFGSIQIDDLMNKLKSFVHISGCDFIILDHLSMCISGLKESDERKLLDMIMTELAAFCASTDVGVIAVTHMNRSVAADFKPPKGKEDEPFWVEVTKEQMRGSAALEQLSWIVLGLEPEIMPDRTRGRVRIVVLKNRPWDALGEADILRMNEQTGLLEDAADPSFMD